MNKHALLNIEAPNKTDAIIVEANQKIPIRAQNYIRANLDKLGPENDYRGLIQKAFENPHLDSRSDLYKAARRFALRLTQGKDGYYNFTDREMEEIFRYGETRQCREMVDMLFPELDIEGEKNARSSAIKALLDAVGIEYRGEVSVLEDIDTMEKGDYRPPSGDEAVIKKINDAVPDADWARHRLNGEQKICVRKLRQVLNSTLYVWKVNCFKKLIERKVFEQEFIKIIYDKPNMIADDINAAMALAGGYVREIQIQELINVYNERLMSVLAGDEKTSGPLALELKTKTDELKECQKFIQAQQKALNQTRSERLKTESEYHRSLAPYITKVADETYRKAMVRAAKVYEDTTLLGEIIKIHELSEDDGEVFGTSVNEILGFRHDILA